MLKFTKMLSAEYKYGRIQLFHLCFSGYAKDLFVCLFVSDFLLFCQLKEFLRGTKNSREDEVCLD